ncbi:MAG: InlB B-repeat-containing protein [Clostridia bacterium]|nr:InlB B-repeat-containing protein [Clostridia bacterium]
MSAKEREQKVLHRLIYKVDGKVCFAEWYAKGESLKSVATPSKGTYLFSGWSNLPDRMPDEDVVIEGTFTPALHDLVYMLEGGEFTRRRIAFGAPTESPEVPEKHGATFAGWEGLPETMPDCDLTVNGRYENNSYRLTYVINGRHSYTVMVPYESVIEPMDAPKKDHYAFTGWEGLPETMPDHDVTVEGRLEMKTFRLVRIVDGEVFMDEQLRIGDKINKKAKPVKQGYYFSGWRNLPDTMPDHDITAVTSMYPARFRVDYELDGEVWRTAYVPYESAFEPEIPTDLDGRVFLGWTDAPKTVPLHDFVVHGSTAAADQPVPEQPAIPTYTLTVTVDGETVAQTILEEGAVIELPAQPVREGYSFAWENAAETMPAGDLTVNGVYTLNLYRLAFVVDGEEISSETLPFGGAITVPTPETKPGKTFAWSDPIPEKMPASDLTITGGYGAGSYTYTFVCNGETVAEGSAPFGAAIIVPEMPELEGQSFEWIDLPAAMPAENITVEGRYVPLDFSVIFRAEGEIVSECRVAAGDPIPAPALPEKTGYTFSGWGRIPETMPAEDLVFDGIFTINDYRLTIIAGTETLFDGSVEFDSPISVPEAPTVKGYTFDGWGDVPKTMPAHDLTIASGYTPVAYPLTFNLNGETIYSRAVSFNSPIIPPEVEIPEGYLFSGWGDLPATMPAKPLTFDATLYGSSYRLTFLLDGQPIYEADLAAGEPIPLPPDPELPDGYEADGWGVVPEVMPAESLTFANYTHKTSYTLRFVLDGETVAQSRVAYGDPVIPPDPEIPSERRFLGWNECPDTMPAHDLTVEGATEIRKTSITFKVDGEVVGTLSGFVGSPVGDPPAAPEKEGMEFLGWFDLPATFPGEDVEIKGDYEAGVQLVTFVLDGEVLEEKKVRFGDPVVPPEVPEKEGYSFGGWNNLADVMPSYGFTVTGVTIPNRHVVTFVVDGETVESRELAFGEEIVCPDLPDDATRKYAWCEIPETMPDCDLTLTATSTVNAHTVTYLLDGEVYRTETVAVGNFVPKINPPKVDGFVFSGWENYSRVMPDYDFTVSGVYRPERFTLTYLSDGEVFATDEYLPGDPIAPVDGSKPDHSEFIEWINLPAVMPSRNVTVNARYATEYYEITYILETTPVATKRVAAGAWITPPLVPEKDGYVFAGWRGLPERMPARDLIVIGKYDPAFHYITYRVDGEFYHRELYPIGATIKPLSAPVKEGRIFVRWNNFADEMPDYDFTVDAVFRDNICKYTFLSEGNVLLAGKLRGGDPLLAPVPEAQKGYEFIGFEGYDGKMPEHDVVYVARFERKVYRVTYLLDGDLYGDDQFREGETVKVSQEMTPSVPDGYEFSGWIGLPSVMPDHDVEVSGTMSPKEYTLSFKADGVKIPARKYVCDGEIGTINAPERHALTFTGWNALPDAMPAHDVTARGAYTPSDGIYVGVHADFDSDGDRPVTVKGKEETEALGSLKRMIAVSGDRIEVNGRKKKMNRVDISNYVSDGVVTDRAGLADAIKRLFNATATKKNDRFALVIDHKASVNGIVTVRASKEDAEAALREEIPAMQSDAGLTGAKTMSTVLSFNESAGTAEGLISVLDATYAETFYDLLNEAGFVTDEPVTPEFFILNALKSKEVHKKGNSIVKFRTDGFLFTALVRDGRVVFSVKNKIPYDLNAENRVETEIDTEFAAVADYIREETEDRFPIRRLVFGGIYSEKKKAEEKYLRRKIKAFNKSQKGFFGRTFTKSKPRLYDFASPVVKKRKRAVIDIDQAARDDKWSSAR